MADLYEQLPALTDWQRDMLRVLLDNRGGTFKPTGRQLHPLPPRRVRVRMGDRWSGPCVVVDELAHLDAPARARRSWMRAAYRRRRA
ncbi:hypothetical protein ABT297_04145 [Dactylosporangium sp. NPDC000555]|uniref:hypothetical protein n=1 Tax=Dactylosporangium sp. NPDC000555 TaxID=3154260 RepID=UPI00333427CC